MIELRNSEMALVGNPPEERTIEEIINNGFVVIDKQAKPSSHQVSAWVRDMLSIEKAGHAGTLDPMVTGVLVVATGKATRVIKNLQDSRKTYIALLEYSKTIKEKKIKEIMKEFEGVIYQTPPRNAAVKRTLRKREIYSINIIEHDEKRTLFEVECEAGTYIRNLCRDIGYILGQKTGMAQLRRLATGPFNEEDSHTLLELRDAFEEWKENGNEEKIRQIILPVENLFEHLPKIVVKDSAVDALCHGAELGLPGVTSISENITRGCIAGIFTLRGEAIGIAKIRFNSEEIKESVENDKKGKIAKMITVLMKRDTYPRIWKGR
tara:strand:- start:15569 stop:16534 length:966 start_codon:yes stop_codon:yes gene_type:complete